jgi:formylglycine-generating enzyme required for sulfatase activity
MLRFLGPFILLFFSTVGLFAQYPCLESNPQVLEAGQISESKLADLVKTHKKTFSSADIQNLKDCIQQHNNNVNSELLKWKNKYSDWSLNWNEVIDLTDIEALEKQVQAQKSKVSELKTKLSEDLGNIPSKGLYVCVLKDLDPYDFNNAGLQEKAKAALSPIAVERINGHFISSLKETVSNSNGQSFISYIQDRVAGELTVSQMLLSKPSPTRTSFVYVALVDVFPLRKMSSGGGVKTTKTGTQVMDLLGREGPNLENLAAFDASWKAEVEQLLETNREGVQQANRIAESQRQRLLEKAGEDLFAVEQELNQLKAKLQRKREDLNRRLTAYGLSSSGSISSDIQKIRGKLSQQLDALYDEYLGIKSKELLFRYDISLAGERSIPEEIGAQGLQLVQQLEKTYGKAEEFESLTELVQGDNLDVFSQRIKQGSRLIREVSKVWVFQEMHGAGWRLSVVARFKVLPGSAAGTAGTTRTNTSTQLPGRPAVEWVNIPAGAFMMGSPDSETDRFNDEGPRHQVTLSGFKMSKYEVTFAQYDVFCEATGRRKPSDNGWGRGNRPVINVDWNDATAFAQWMGCRLPTEAEWEYACRAGTSTPFNTGGCLSTALANYDGNYPYSNCIKGSYLKRPQPVGSYAPNAWGLYDMHGNVMEWCSDWYGDYSSYPQTNPGGPASGSTRVLRGGSWFFSGRHCRSANRNYNDPSYRSFSSGFRLVVPS